MQQVVLQPREIAAIDCASGSFQHSQSECPEEWKLFKEDMQESGCSHVKEATGLLSSRRTGCDRPPFPWLPMNSLGIPSGISTLDIVESDRDRQMVRPKSG
jgi:hypothetical protein